MNDDIVIRPAREHADFDACVALQRAVWRLADLEITSTIQLIATTHAGGSLLLACTPQGQPVGFAYAFAALRGGMPHLHSDMLAVLPEHQRRGLGARLKWAQRDAALAQGVSLITWTYDPLQARNAHLNLRVLGTKATEFLPNFYGITTSTLHHGLPTDRLLVRWELNAPAVFDRLAGRQPAPAAAEPAPPRVNDVKWQGGWPVSSEPRLELEERELQLEIPPDWDVLCAAAPRVAEDWHGKVRRAFQAYIGRGYAAVDFLTTQEGGRGRPLYLLARP
jgi:predicted GNAT superfamily acetyltransferase